MKANNSYPKFPELTRPKPRPKSFSEGNTVSNHFPKYDELSVNQENSFYDELSDEQPTNTNNICSTIYIKLLGFIFHLVLISVFELLFFNYYIIQYENNALILLTNSLINPIINSCQTLSNTSKIVVDRFINIFINETIINNAALSDYNTRLEFNNDLFTRSIMYSTGVILVFFFLLSLNCCFKLKINYMTIILDNIAMICILGVYEYLFFKNIVFNYALMTPNELTKNLIVNLLQSC